MKTSFLSTQLSRVLLAVSLLGLLGNTAFAAYPYVDICGTITVNGVPKKGVTVQAILCGRRCGTGTVVVADVTDDSPVNNYHLVFLGPDDPSLPPDFCFGEDGCYSPISVYLKFSYPGCQDVIVSCDQVEKGYAATSDGKLSVDLNLKCSVCQIRRWSWHR